MPTMTHLILLLAVIVGSLHMSAHGSSTSPDYYDEDDSSQSPGNLAKATAAPLRPYFEQNETVIYVLANATNVKLNCPAKNYNLDALSVLWYRNQTLLVNGNQAIINIYSMDNPLVLNAPAVNATGHDFYCQLLPANLTHQISVRRGPPPTNGAVSLIPTVILGALLLIHF